MDEYTIKWFQLYQTIMNGSSWGGKRFADSLAAQMLEQIDEMELYLSLSQEDKSNFLIKRDEQYVINCKCIALAVVLRGMNLITRDEKQANNDKPLQDVIYSSSADS